MPISSSSSSRKRKNKTPLDTQSKRQKARLSLASDEAGIVLVLGQGELGQLGLGEEILERSRPTAVKKLLEVEFIQVACGGVHTVALTKAGEIYTWGCNDECALGRDTSDTSEAEYLPGLVDGLDNVKIIQVSAGDNHTAALADDGRVFCWGNFWDNRGSIGLNLAGKQPRPIVMLGDPNDPVIKIGSGNNHVAALTANGLIFTWGCGEQGQLGRVAERFCSRDTRQGLKRFLQPAVARVTQRSKKDIRFSDIFVGPYNLFAVNAAGEVFACGLNNYGQIGNGNITSLYYLAKIDSLSALNDGNDERQILIASGEHHTLILARNGRVYSIGRGDYGRLGLGPDVKECSHPTEIETLANSDIKAVTCGLAVSFAVSNSGDVYSWGMGTNLQLGSSTDDDILTPTLVKTKESYNFFAASAGGQHTAILGKKK
ncbi:uncharacterized protein TRIADDRAFT_58118 [Trichoplax adhaerens]|uniref:RCC1-like domain-containing protein n=1 Tax=Trichoplax adhaerens TaxID=10228 RepID=B3S0X4_TRIAD|nr:hypothetical protein TRIADDRAFT_58118 [Trichoplax adhaerens]EDV23138.1 hypothetical protein TRIADDRAFT_58118 [Trichoplax adhaerens]|eukprot:XP_002114048.1 hypothetical protein TRIADDRAFT_58118 [Trichoplax adhaerens]